MATDLFRRVKFSEGEGVDHQDMDDIGRFVEARICDQVIRATTRSARVASGPPDRRTSISTAPFLYALSGGAGYIFGAGALQTTVRAGTILQQVGSPNGAEPSFLPYTMADSEFTLTHAAGDATNARIDVIEVKLELVDANLETRDFKDAITGALTSISTAKKRRAQATFQIKRGTPAATPAFPSLTAGFAALGAVRVPALHTGGFDENHLIDLRIPIGVKPAEVAASVFAHSGGSSLNVANGIQFIHVPPSSSAQISIPCPIPVTARIVGVEAFGFFNASSCSFTLGEYVVSNPSVVPIVIGGGGFAALAPAMGIDTPTPVWRWARASMAQIEDASAVGSFPAAKNAEGLGAGIWGNGRRFGPIHETMELDLVAGIRGFQRARAFMNVQTGAGENVAVALVRWYYADGLC